MRKIGSYQAEESKRKRNVQLFSLGLLFLMVLSTVGYAFFSNPDVGNYDGSVSGDTGLRQYGDKWIFGPNERPIVLSHSPSESNVTELSFSFGIENYLQEPLFIDSENITALNEIAGVFGYYASRMQEACYLSCERDIPEKDCSENIIVFKDSNINSVRQQDKCIFIEGDLRAVDSFVYSLFGISNS